MTVQNKKENMVSPSAPRLQVHSVICRDLETWIQSLHMQHAETLLHRHHHLNIEMPNGRFYSVFSSERHSVQFGWIIFHFTLFLGKLEIGGVEGREVMCASPWLARGSSYLKRVASHPLIPSNNAEIKPDR